jgi:hypothetical protein
LIAPLPAPPNKQANARCDQAGQSSADGGARNRRGRGEKAMLNRPVVNVQLVQSDNLAFVVDAKGLGIRASWETKGSVAALAVNEAVVVVPTDHLALIIDPVEDTANGTEGGVNATAVEKTISGAVDDFISDDLSAVVNACG